MLRLRSTSFSYSGAAEPTLKNLTLDIPAGTMVAILGPQGSGTSTLCRLLAGMLAEHGEISGKIHTGGDEAQSHPLALMLGEDPEAQLTGMASLAGDEIRLPGRLHGLSADLVAQRADRAMQTLDITHLAQRRVETLSGGERQLTALAGLLTLGDESLLVLDQPTLSLDATARVRLIGALQQHCAGGGSVLVTGHQYDDVTAACQQIRFLTAGQLSDNPTDSPRLTSSEPGEQAAAEETDTAITTAELSAHGIWDARPPESAAPPGAERSAPPASSASSASCGPVSDSSSPTALEVRDLSVRRAGRRILSSVNLHLSAGEVIAVLGANGSGKSTLITALAGLLENKPDTEVTAQITAADGTDLAALPAYLRTGHLAWVGQDPGAQISASSVQKELNQALPPSRGRRTGKTRQHSAEGHRARQIAEVLERAGLTRQVDEHPYDLSPSQRKDLVIASAMLLTPRALLLDEPTLGRDEPSMTQLNRLIAELTENGTAVLLSTHDHRWAHAVATATYHLEDGVLSAA